MKLVERGFQSGLEVGPQVGYPLIDTILTVGEAGGARLPVFRFCIDISLLLYCCNQAEGTKEAWSP